MDQSVAIVFEKHPLLAFSVLSHIQTNALISLGCEIEDLIAKAITGPSTVDAATLNRAYVLLWLWVLGAYEALRTMSQARNRFASELADRISQEKRYLARLRMPLSKQEYAGNKGPSGSAGLISGIDTKKRDVNLTVGEEQFGAEEIFSRFNRLISSIKLTDILPLQNVDFGQNS